MPEVNPIKAEIREKQFMQALVDNGGVINKAYKAISPNCKHSTALVEGSKYLASLTKSKGSLIEQTLEEIGATPKVICQEVLKRANNTKGSRDYLNSARFLAKVGGWDTPKERFSIDMGDNSLEVVDIVRVRLKKKRSSDNVIDVK